MMKRFALTLILAAAVAFTANAQKFAIGTNFVEWGTYGTANVDFSMSFARHFTAVAGATINPWDFTNDDGVMYDKEKSVYAGVRYWPWYVFSGLWIQAKCQFKDYQETGIWRPALDEGKAVGGGLALGYTFMIHEKFNIELGFGGWGGRLIDHTLYCCPEKCWVRESGPKWFYDLDEVSVAFYFLF